MGGTCSYPKVNLFIVFSKSHSSSLGTSCSSITLPVISCVSVAIPSFTVATYSLSFSVIYSIAFVAFPMQIVSTPSASGSRVPACPTFLIFKAFLTFITTSCDVQPFSLYIFIIPFISLILLAPLLCCNY